MTNKAFFNNYQGLFLIMKLNLKIEIEMNYKVRINCINCDDRVSKNLLSPLPVATSICIMYFGT